MENISNTQVKFVLDQSDLMERNINLFELKYGSENTHKFFRDLMEQATGYDFNAINTPLMIETFPQDDNNLVIIATKYDKIKFDKVLQRGLLGFSLGISIGYVITIISSFIGENGSYLPIVLPFVGMVGNEIGAVTIQTLLFGILGWGAANILAKTNPKHYPR